MAEYHNGPFAVRLGIRCAGVHPHGRAHRPSTRRHRRRVRSSRQTPGPRPSVLGSTHTIPPPGKGPRPDPPPPSAKGSFLPPDSGTPPERPRIHARDAPAPPVAVPGVDGNRPAGAAEDDGDRAG